MEAATTRRLGMRPSVQCKSLRVARAAVVSLVIAACATPAKAPSYLGSVSFRRMLLERSLVNHDNAYARLRLAHYGEDWEQLPEWNPRVATYDFDETSPPARALDSSSLGEEAFFRYPVQIVPALASLRSRAEASSYGLTNIVRVDLDNGEHALAVTCATCHAREGAPGVPNDRLDFGRLLVDHGGLDAKPRLAWGAGRLDVTTTRGDEVVRIPDLRPVRFLTHLHHAATLASTDVETLAVRLETLIVTSNGGALRPPRAVASSLAAYLWSLADTLPSRSPTTSEERSGQRLFGTQCARCHVPPAFTGPPVAVDEVGTDPTVARSPDRGTGMYRVPSLRGVSTRGALLHDGTVPNLDALFEPTRTQGHPYGLTLDEARRRDLLAYLRTL
jgi:mono/diheme cytochrome c family protein